MERHERRDDHFAMSPSFPYDGGIQQYHDERQDQLISSHHNQSDNLQHDWNGEHNNLNVNSNNFLPLSGNKRHLPHTNAVNYGDFVKLYVVGIPRTATEQDISMVFEEHGNVVEVVILKDKRTGFQQECCFVKLSTVEQADRAIGLLHGQYIFPKGMIPIKIKYADGERERLGSVGMHVHKLYVGGLNRQTSKREIDEIFSAFGVIEDIYVVRDEFKQNRGCAFVQFSCRDMAIAAIQALHVTYAMEGCNQPLIVRFADPKKPRLGDSRSGPFFDDYSSGNMLFNEMQQMKSSDSVCKTTPLSSNSFSDVEQHSTKCDWSEHVSPDGDLYYYNCVTCESRWEMPEEYACYYEFDDPDEQQESRLQTTNTPQVSEKITCRSPLSYIKEF